MFIFLTAVCLQFQLARSLQKIKSEEKLFSFSALNPWPIQVFLKFPAKNLFTIFDSCLFTISELNKALTQDIVNHETGNFELISRNFHNLFTKNVLGLEKVVESVAVFKKPKAGSSGKGRYELRPEFYKEYNVFFYRYGKNFVKSRKFCEIEISLILKLFC